MKQVLQYRRSGRTQVVEVPAPLVPEGGVLVHNRWSLISPGTERMLVEAGGANLVNTALQRPELVKQVLDSARRNGVQDTVQKVRSRIDTAIPLGYSCAGIVLEAGPAADTFRPGDRVACAGAGEANHAEFVAVAKNLVARVPDGVSDEDAAFVTLGAIALQGVRRADVRVGETCVVIGLGMVGQLTLQLLKAAGCRVFGIDVAADKVDLALRWGADDACLRAEPGLVDRVRRFSGGFGADAVLITAGTSTSDPIELAPSLVRDRATVVAVGLVGMNVPRNAYYEKELDVRLSRSYGPGRYDRGYEVDGVDYPIGYVRWTEQRNMQAFLQLVAEGKVQPSRLITHRIPVEEAERAYAIVTGAMREPYLGILLEYPREAEPRPLIEVRQPVRTAPSTTGTVRVGMVGAGNFGKAVLLPRLKQMGDMVALRGLAAATGPSAQQTAQRFGFAFASSDWRSVVDDPDTDAVLVATRHDLHAVVTAAALRAGKAVFVEKPLALSEDGLEQVMDAWQTSGRPLLVGFNRRFSPAVQQVKALYAGRAYPLVMNFRVNAGAVAATSWVVDARQGGGRLLGEVCHMVDTLGFLADAPVRTVFAQALPAAADFQADDVLLTLTFADGSIGTVVYASGGDRSLSKERLEVFGGGMSAVLDDFVRLTIHRGGRETVAWKGAQDKGHAAEIATFVRAVREGGPSPIPPEYAQHVTRVTLAAMESVRAGVPIEL